MSSIFTVHRQPYGEVINPISADGVRFHDKNGNVTEVSMVDGMVNIRVGGVTVSAEHLEDLMRPPSAPVGVSRYVRDERGRMMRDDKAEPKIGYGTGWNACLDAIAQQPAADGGFSAADMMDARQEGRKEAQQQQGGSDGR